MSQSAEIVCPACGEAALLRREPVYDGLRKTGEKLSCFECGHRFADEDSVPFKRARRPSILDDDDAPSVSAVFSADERNRCCRHCRHYLVNPFTQRCAVHKREVTATDLCDRFALRPSDLLAD